MFAKNFGILKRLEKTAFVERASRQACFCGFEGRNNGVLCGYGFDLNYIVCGSRFFNLKIRFKFIIVIFI